VVCKTLDVAVDVVQRALITRAERFVRVSSGRGRECDTSDLQEESEPEWVDLMVVRRRTGWMDGRGVGEDRRELHNPKGGVSKYLRRGKSHDTVIADAHRVG
jgi:hypothetical protein